MKKKYLENDGFALASVLIIMFVLMILGTALLTVVFSDTKHAIYSENNLEASFLARAGADIVSNIIIDTDAIPNGIIGVKQDLSDAFGNKSFTVKSLTTVGSKLNVIVSAEVNGVNEEITLVLDEVIGDAQAFQRPFYVNKEVDRGEKENNKDKLLINYPEGFTEAEKDAHKPLSGEDAQPFVYLSPVIVTPNLTENIPFDLTISKGKIETFKTSLSFSSLTVNGGKIVLNTNSNSTLQLVIDELVVNKSDAKNDGIIEVTGNGKVEIFVNQMNLSQGALLKINEENARVEIFITGTKEFGYEPSEIDNPLTNLSPSMKPDKLLIVLADETSLKLGSNAEITGYIYGPNANVYMNSAKTTLNGAIISNIFNKQEDSNAPMGVINFVPLNDPDFKYEGVTGYSKSQYKRGN